MPSALADALTRYLDAHGWGEGVFRTPIDGVAVMRTTDSILPTHTIYRPCLCVVVQGAKQKQLRLVEARRLMLVEGVNASSAAYQVGYESASQFSREYSRMFGVAPKRDALELKRASA
jgi:hypothetical protein